ncbi:hypothetical protein RI367_003206 [Sorochytrium milnesiophthora]
MATNDDGDDDSGGNEARMQFAALQERHAQLTRAVRQMHGVVSAQQALLTTAASTIPTAPAVQDPTRPKRQSLSKSSSVAGIPRPVASSSLRRTQSSTVASSSSDTAKPTSLRIPTRVVSAQTELNQTLQEYTIALSKHQADSASFLSRLVQSGSGDTEAYVEAVLEDLVAGVEGVEQRREQLRQRQEQAVSKEDLLRDTVGLLSDINCMESRLAGAIRCLNTSAPARPTPCGLALLHTGLQEGDAVIEYDTLEVAYALH